MTACSCYAACVTVSAEQESVPPVVIVTVEMVQLDPDVAQVPSCTAVPSLLVRRYHAAVPATVLVSLEMALAAFDPELAAAKAVELSAKCANFVWVDTAVSAVAG